MKNVGQASLLLLLLAGSAYAQQRPPVIDIHLHAQSADAQGPPPLGLCTPIADPFPAWDPAKPYEEVFMAIFKKPACNDPIWSPLTDEEIRVRTLEVMERNNVYGVVSGPPDRVSSWMKAAPGRFLPAYFPGLAADPAAGTAAMRVLHARGALAAVAEVSPQYGGLAVLYSHPQVYVEVGIIAFAFPPATFYRFLQGLVEGGFGNRVMFGSDQMVWPEAIERATQVIEKAPFLTEEQKRSILYNNAARFLRLSDQEIARHHGR